METRSNNQSKNNKVSWEYFAVVNRKYLYGFVTTRICLKVG